MQFNKVIVFAKQNDIDFVQCLLKYEDPIEELVTLTIHLNNYMMVIYDHCDNPLVELYTNIDGDDAEMYDYGYIEQYEIIGIIMGDMELSRN